MTGDAGLTPAAVLEFWRSAGSEKWFAKDAAFDAEIRARFLPAWEAAAGGQLTGWEETAQGALALTIVLDQFPRNMFRGDPRTYQEDAAARAVGARAIARGFDLAVPHDERQFFYLPFMHSETLADQEHCVALAERYGDDEFLGYALRHADIVRRFGRFPHRNALLGRATTAEEQAFLDGGGFRG